MDKRVPLPIGTTLEISDGNSRIKVTISEVIGYGGSCIAYSAKNAVAGTDATRIVKEFYPASLTGISRVGMALNVPAEEIDAFNERRREFERGISKYSNYYETYDSSAAPRPFIYGEANGTCYSVSDYSTGKVLTDKVQEGLNLYRVANIMVSLCVAISQFHEDNLLYLDCKPENIFFYTFDHKEDHVRLFDFDTVMSIAEAKEHPERLSTTKGWAPPELLYGNSDEIGERTDIYSVGAVFFWLLTGRKPNERSTDITSIENGNFDWKRVPMLRKCSAEVIQIVEKILKKTLLSYDSRYHDISGLEKDFGAIKNLRSDNPVLSDKMDDIKASIEQVIEIVSAKSANESTNAESVAANPNREEFKQRNIDSQSYIGGVNVLYSDGSTYKGMWRNGCRNGYGVYIRPDGEKYEGEFNADLYNGRGTYWFADGSVYEGEWKDGVFNGKGVMMYANHSKYTGEWSNGQRSGSGIYFYPDGKTLSGKFVNDAYCEVSIWKERIGKPLPIIAEEILFAVYLLWLRNVGAERGLDGTAILITALVGGICVLVLGVTCFLWDEIREKYNLHIIPKSAVIIALFIIAACFTVALAYFAFADLLSMRTGLFVTIGTTVSFYIVDCIIKRLINASMPETRYFLPESSISPKYNHHGDGING